MHHHVIDDSECGTPEDRIMFYDKLKTLPQGYKSHALEIGSYCGSMSSIFCNYFDKLTIIENYTMHQCDNHTNTNSYNITYDTNGMYIKHVEMASDHKHLNRLDTMRYNLNGYNNYKIIETDFHDFKSDVKFDFVLDDITDTEADFFDVGWVIRNRDRLIKAFELVRDGGMYCLCWEYWFIKNRPSSSFITKLLHMVRTGKGLVHPIVL